MIAAIARHPWRAAWIAGFALASTTLFFGFFLDDYVHMLTIDERVPFVDPWSLYMFSPGTPEGNALVRNDGPMPWWGDPEIKIRFFRPLSSLLMRFDYAAFGGAAWPYHVHSLLWYALLCGAAAALYRRALAAPALGALALLLYLVDESHWLPAGWWSNRHAVVSSALSLWGVAAHVRWREDGWRPGLPLSLAGLALGLAGGETAVGAFGYLGAYELLAARGAWASRARALAPAFALALAYAALYKGLGYGMRGSGVYFDPAGEFVPFLLHAPVRALALIGALVLNVPPEPAAVAPAFGVLFAAIGIAAGGLFAWALRRALPQCGAGPRRHLPWLLAGALLSMAPALATFPAGRLLTLPSAGFAAAIAVVLHAAWPRWRAQRSRLDGAIAMAIVLVHMAGVVPGWLLPTAGIRFLDARSRAAMAQPIEGPSIAGRDAITIAAFDPMAAIYPRIYFDLLGRPLPRRWRTLSAALADHRIVRVAPNAIEVEILDGELLANPVETLIRARGNPICPGDVFPLDGLTVTVLECGAHGPRRMRFDFGRPLDDPQYAWLAWRNGAFRRVALPPVGASIDMPYSPGLLHPETLFRPIETHAP